MDPSGCDACYLPYTLGADGSCTLAWSRIGGTVFALGAFVSAFGRARGGGFVMIAALLMVAAALYIGVSVVETSGAWLLLVAAVAGALLANLGGSQGSVMASLQTTFRQRGDRRRGGRRRGGWPLTAATARHSTHDEFVNARAEWEAAAAPLTEQHWEAAAPVVAVPMDAAAAPVPEHGSSGAPTAVANGRLVASNGGGGEPLAVAPGEPPIIVYTAAGVPVEGTPSIYPSGAWRGYYIHPALTGRQHGVVEFQLEFRTDGTLHGGGVDDVGAYTIVGRHRAGRVAFTKT